MTLTFDLDLDPMTFTYKLNVDLIKMYLYAKNEVPRSRRSKVIHQTLKLILTLKFDLDLDLMTLICKPDIDTWKIYLHAKNEVCSLRHSKVIG